MDKELIKEFQSEYDYHKNGGWFWIKLHGYWSLTNNFSWNNNVTVDAIVKNDEFSEQNKAIIDNAFKDKLFKDFIGMEKEIEFLKEQIKLYRFDYLTGLKMRVDFEHDFNTKFNEKEGFYLALYDIDGLHETNRLYGEDAGDALIKRVSNDLRLCETPCHVYRYHSGGDEFGVIFCNNEKPNNFNVLGTTHSYGHSLNYSSSAEMMRSLAANISAQKKLSKKRRRGDI